MFRFRKKALYFFPVFKIGFLKTSPWNSYVLESSDRLSFGAKTLSFGKFDIKMEFLEFLSLNFFDFVKKPVLKEDFCGFLYDLCHKF